MSEQIQTGGLKRFDWSIHKQKELDPERRRAIEIGYAEADERRRKEIRNKILFWIVVGLIIVGILGYILIKN